MKTEFLTNTEKREKTHLFRANLLCYHDNTQKINKLTENIA